MEIIAEIGQNHNGDMTLAKELIFAAKESGADVAKFQIFNAEETFGKENNPWIDYNKKTELSRDDVNLLYEECQRCQIEFMSSIFHSRYIDWLEQLDVKRYKVASRSIYDKDLLNSLLFLKKPLIISLGFWKEENFPNLDSNNKIDYLFCISKYPTNLSDLNLNKVNFKEYSGFSDHSIGTSAAIYALSNGAKIVEKHFTLDKNMHGPDHNLSANPEDLTSIVKFRDDLKKINR